MRRYSKDFENVPPFLSNKYQNWSMEMLAQKQRFITEKRKTKIKNVLDRLYDRDTVLSQKPLNEIYTHFCAFCECDMKAELIKPTIEHYRPKGQGVFENTDDPTQPATMGYYWLCIEWSNLFPTCSGCNDLKKNDFSLPDETKRLKKPILNASGNIDFHENTADKLNAIENPYFLHPEIDEPSEHLFIDNLVTGGLGHRSERGEKTITLLRLNEDRVSLLRKSLIDNIKETIARKLIEIAECPEGMRKTREFNKALEESFSKVFDELHPDKISDKSFSLLRATLWENFEEAFLRSLTDEGRDLIRTAKSEYLKNINTPS